MQGKGQLFFKSFLYELIDTDSQCFVDVIGHNQEDETIAVRFKYDPWFEVRCDSRETADLLTHEMMGKQGFVRHTIEYKDLAQYYCRTQLKGWVTRLEFKTLRYMYYAKKDLIRNQEAVKLPEYGDLIVYQYRNKRHIQVDGNANHDNQKLRFMLLHKLKTVTWMKVREAVESNFDTKFIHHYTAPPEGITLITDEEAIKLNLPKVSPLILSFDYESFPDAFRQGSLRFPDPVNPLDDMCYLATVVISKGGKLLDVYFITHMPHKYPPNQTIEGAPVTEIRVNNSVEAAHKVFELIEKHNVDLITGFNVFGYDNKVTDLISRYSLTPIPNFSRYNDFDCEPDDRSWGNSAHKVVSGFYFKCQGRVWLDMMIFCQVIINDRHRSYSLRAMARSYLKDHEQKLDLTPAQQFQNYVNGDITKTIIYGLMDSVIPVKLFEILGAWGTLSAHSNLKNMDIFDIYTRGVGAGGFKQAYSELYKSGYFMATQHKIVADKYVGAIVLPAKVGYWRYITTLDFSGMYPSIIMAHNICWTTIVRDSNVPDCDCNCFMVPDTQGRTKKVRFIKPEFREGILPAFLRYNKAARAQVKKDQKNYPYGSDMWKLLESKQLGFKLASNGVYGLLGTKDSKFCCFDAAATVTFVGRTYITQVESYMKNEMGAVIVTGDSDSVMFYIDGIEKELHRIEEYGNQLAAIISDKFPADVVIEFEKIWEHYILLSKKNYVGYLMDFKNKGNVLFDIHNKYFQAKGIIKRIVCEGAQHMMVDMCNTLFQHPDNPEKMLDVYRDYLDRIESFPVEHMTQSVVIGDMSAMKDTVTNARFHANMNKKGKLMRMGDRVEYVFLKHKQRPEYIGDRMMLVDFLELPIMLDNQDKEEYQAAVQKCVANSLDYWTYVEAFAKKGKKLMETIAKTDELRSHYLHQLKNITAIYLTKYK